MPCSLPTPAEVPYVLGAELSRDSCVTLAGDISSFYLYLFVYKLGVVIPTSWGRSEDQMR